MPSRAPAPSRCGVIGEHPDDGQPVAIFKGRYGPYIRHGRVMASLRKGQEIDSVSLEDAVEMIAAKAARGGKKAPKRTKAAAKKAPAKKAKAKKTAAKKPAAKKPCPRKAAPRQSAAGD